MDLDDLEDLKVKGSKLTCPGEYLTSSQAYMRGHGTYVDSEEVVASVAGTVERVNKLVTVRAIRSRYNPEVGDLVVGRITEVQPRRWKVDTNSRQDAVLMLSSVNLPGGVQRRKLESDELQMRGFFEEGDLLVAEVQAFFSDGVMSLHTRSLKYGKVVGTDNLYADHSLKFAVIMPATQRTTSRGPADSSSPPQVTFLDLTLRG